MKTKILLFFLFLCGGIFWGAVVDAKSSMEDNYFVASERVIEENFFKAGNAIDIAGTLKKDAYVIGNIVTVDGVIEGDLIGAGSTLKINGEVKGSVRFIAENIIINGQVGKNLLAAGNLINLENNGSVGWEVLSAGNLIDMKGKVGSDLKAIGTILNINNEINGRVHAQMTEINLGDQALITGDFNYYSEKDLVKKEQAQILGQINKIENFGFTKSQPAKDFSYYLGKFIFSYLSFLLLAIVLIVLMRKKIDLVTMEIKSNLAKNLGWGILLLFGVPLLAVLILLTIVGLPISLVVMMIYFAVVLVSRIFVSIVIWRFIAQLVRIKQPLDLMLQALIGLFVYSLLCVIPIVGALLNLLAIAVSLSAVFLVFRQSEK